MTVQKISKNRYQLFKTSALRPFYYVPHLRFDTVENAISYVEKHKVDFVKKNNTSRWALLDTKSLTFVAFGKIDINELLDFALFSREEK